MLTQWMALRNNVHRSVYMDDVASSQVHRLASQMRLIIIALFGATMLA